MTEIYELIMAYVSIWAPSLMAIAGMAFTWLKGKAALKELKGDAELKQLRLEIATANRHNAELVRCNKLLLDKITKIEGYADNVEELK